VDYVVKNNYDALFHPPVLLSSVIKVILTFLVSSISWKYIEVPFNALKERYTLTEKAIVTE
jgi:peptidoglycan/LPS O-acetylase OafA/YrhL